MKKSRRRNRKHKKIKKTRGDRAKDSVATLKILGDDEVSKEDMLAFLNNANEIFNGDMLEDERARNKRGDWSKMTDTQRARIMNKLSDLKKRGDDFSIELDPSMLPEGEEGERVFEECLSRDPDKHDFERHPNVKSERHRACFWWYESWGKDSMPPITLSHVQMQVINEKTRYNTFLSVISRVWEDGNLLNRWKGKTLDKVNKYIENNYGEGEACVITSKEGGVRFSCYPIDKGGRYHVCISLDVLDEDMEKKDVQLPPSAIIFPIVCECAFVQPK